MQARRSRTHGDSVGDARKIRDRSFKFLHLRTDTQSRSSQHAHHGLDIGLGNIGARKRNSHAWPVRSTARVRFINNVSPSGTDARTETILCEAHPSPYRFAIPLRDCRNSWLLAVPMRSRMEAASGSASSTLGPCSRPC